jgi:hypothetical protein
LRGARLRIVITTEEIMRASRRDALQEIGERGEARVAAALVIEGDRR